MTVNVSMPTLLSSSELELNPTHYIHMLRTGMAIAAA